MNIKKIFVLCIVSCGIFIANNTVYSSNTLDQVIDMEKTTIEDLSKYTALIRSLRKYNANLSEQQDSTATITVTEARTKYKILDKLLNNHSTARDLNGLILDNYNYFKDSDEDNTGMQHPVLKIMNDNIIKSIDNDMFKHNFKYLFNKVVNTLLKDHCAFISTYSPSNAKNFDVSNLFFAAWHVLIKYAKENIHNISDKPLYKTLIDLLEKCKDSFGTSINYNLLGIQDHNVIQNNNSNQSNMMMGQNYNNMTPNYSNINNQNNMMQNYNNMQNMMMNNGMNNMNQNAMMNNMAMNQNNMMNNGMSNMNQNVMMNNMPINQNNMNQNAMMNNMAMNQNNMMSNGMYQNNF